MKNGPIIIEINFNASISKVWNAITDKGQMKQWYFEFAEFKAKAGFDFQFFGGTEEKQYLHLCKILEVTPEKKISYSWCYDGYEGYSVVSFELFEEKNQTRFKLTHEGLDTFPADNLDFAKENFVQGWNYIIGKSLKDFLDPPTT
jgi:uncharacterized protein YndB with AHSA1/START domain